MQLIGTLDTQLYPAVELPDFHSKTENQVTLGRALLFVYPCGIQFIHLGRVNNVLITVKSVVIVEYFLVFTNIEYDCIELF